MSLLPGRSILFLMSWIPTFSERFVTNYPPLYLWSVPLFSSSSKHALVTHLCKIPFLGPTFSSWFYSFPLLSSHPDWLEELCPYSYLFTHQLPPTAFLPTSQLKLFLSKYLVTSMLPSLMDTPQSSCYVTSQWTLTKLTLPSFWEKPCFLGIQAPTFFCLFTFFFLLCGCISLSLCQIFLFYLTLKCWNCPGSALDPFLLSFYTLCLSQLTHFHGLISMLRALKCVQLPRHFSNLKSHSNTCFASLLRHHKHICLELNSWSFPPCWRPCIFPLQIHSLPRRLTWFTCLWLPLGFGHWETLERDWK